MVSVPVVWHSSSTGINSLGKSGIWNLWHAHADARGTWLVFVCDVPQPLVAQGIRPKGDGVAPACRVVQ